MTGPPPTVGRLLLRALAPPSDHDFVAGDLQEEFSLHAVPTRGARAAQRWYLRQVLRCTWPFVLLRLRRGGFVSALLAVQVCVVLPLVGLDAFWSFILSSVPLRADTIAPVFAAATAVGLAAAAGAGAFVRLRADRERGVRSALGFALVVLVVTGLLTAGGGVLGGLSTLLLPLVPLSAMAGGLLSVWTQPAPRSAT